MPYCRICGAQLEENAYFCHKCGTPIVTLTSVPPPLSARSTQKKRISPEVIVLVAVVAVAIIVSIIVFSLLFSVNFNQTNNNTTQGNTMKLSFNLQDEATKVCVLNQNLIQKTSLINNYSFAVGYNNLYGSR